MPERSNPSGRSAGSPRPGRDVDGWRSRWGWLVVLGVGVLALSSAAPMILFAGASGLVTALYRVAISAALMGGLWSAFRRLGTRGADRGLGRGVVGRRELGYAVLSGVALGLHFWSWMHSLTITSVASSMLFVTTTPVWAALAGPLVGDERLTPSGWLGLTVALAGGSVIVLGGVRGLGEVRLVGVGFALLGAWMAAIYMVLGRMARRRMGILAYGAVTNGAATLTLLGSALAVGERLTGFSTSTWLAFAGLALVPQLVGHNSLNWALRYTDAARVSTAVLLEPVGASLLAALLLGASIAGFEVLGGTLLLFGVGIVLRGGVR